MLWGHRRRGEYSSPILVFEMLKELSIFIDESGDFGEFVNTAPYYIVTFVFHQQEKSIADKIERLELQLKNCGFEDEYIHTHPIIRREFPYHNLTLDDRRRILNKMLRFTMSCEISYFNIVVNKKEADDKFKLSGKIAKKLSRFINDNSNYFDEYDNIIVYYDNGQHELSVIINTILNTFFSNVEFRKASPKEYKLLQVADFVCSMELLKQKQESHMLTNSEEKFFYRPQELKKNYLKSIKKKEFKNKK